MGGATCTRVTKGTYGGAKRPPTQSRRCHRRERQRPAATRCPGCGAIRTGARTCCPLRERVPRTVAGATGGRFASASHQDGPWRSLQLVMRYRHARQTSCGTVPRRGQLTKPLLTIRVAEPHTIQPSPPGALDIVPSKRDAGRLGVSRPMAAPPDGSFGPARPSAPWPFGPTSGTACPAPTRPMALSTSAPRKDAGCGAGWKPCPARTVCMPMGGGSHARNARL
jgi:hypothetical protein